MNDPGNGMGKPIVFMFSGQGSRYFQMGRELYDHHPRFRLWMDHCDTLVRDATGRSLTAEIYHEGDRAISFDDIVLTNPALLSIEFCLAMILREAGIFPDYLLGVRKLTDNKKPATCDDIALILHTSGTTGKPKKVPLSHGRLCLTANNIRRTLQLTEEDRCLQCMPLFHVHGILNALGLVK